MELHDRRPSWSRNERPMAENVPDVPTEKNPCPICKSDFEQHLLPGGRHDRWNDPFVHRGFHLPVTPETNTTDAKQLVDVLINRGTPIGTKFSTDRHLAEGNFAFPPSGKVGALVTVRSIPCQNRAHVDPGYSHEEEVRAMPGTPLHIAHLHVYPNPELPDNAERDRYGSKIHPDVSHFLKTREAEA